MRLASLLLALLCLAIGADAQPRSSDSREAAERTKLASLEKSYALARSEHERTRTSSSRRRLVDSTVSYATAVMLSPILRPQEKYPKALRLYREALRLDPQNQEARKNKEMIEEIYRSMGRPIPK